VREPESRQVCKRNGRHRCERAFRFRSHKVPNRGHNRVEQQAHPQFDFSFGSGPPIGPGEMSRIIVQRSARRQDLTSFRLSCHSLVEIRSILQFSRLLGSSSFGGFVLNLLGRRSRLTCFTQFALIFVQSNEFSRQIQIQISIPAQSVVRESGLNSPVEKGSSIGRHIIERPHQWRMVRVASGPSHLRPRRGLSMRTYRASGHSLASPSPLNESILFGML
jgi:hypothetical protein